MVRPSLNDYAWDVTWVTERQQGYLELSNVSVVQEMVNLILAQRAYEVNSKAVQAADQMMQDSINLQH